MRLANSFGQQRIGRLVGLVFVSHQIGAALAAVAGGWAYMQFGDYHYAFLTGAIMGLLAAGLALNFRSGGSPPQVVPVATEFAQA